MKRFFYAYLIIVLVLSACSSGKSTFERGNYYEAVITSVNRLRKNSDHKKSVETLRMAYPMAVRFYEDRANTAIASAEPFKWSAVVNAYTTINNMYDEIKRCPGAMRVIPDPVNSFSKLQEARQNAAEENYAAGIHALQANEREKAKQAYAFFKTANEFVPGYKDVINYMEAALSAATVKILVEPIPVHSKSAGVSAEFFNDKISEFVHSAPISEFVRFYTRAEAETIKLNPDHIIQLAFDDFTVGQVYKHEKEIHLTKDSIVMATYVTPTAASEPSDAGRTVSSTKTGLVVAGNSVVAASETTPATANTTPSKSILNTADAQKAALERAERERAERERAEAIQEEKRLAEQVAAERAMAEKLRLEKEAAEKARAERDAAAERAKAAQTLEEKARAERELAEKIKAEKAQAERERIAQQQLQEAAAEKARLEAEKAAMEAERARIEAEKAKLEAEKAKIAVEKAKIEAEKARLEKERIEKEKAAKEAADLAQTAKAKAEKEKEEADKAKYVDPTINPADTTNVKDPVTICHIPPGNKKQRRTLKISRSALKAHLGHGDVVGDCSGDDKAVEGAPQNQKDAKGSPENEKGKKEKPTSNPKGKGPGASNDSGAFERNNYHALRYNEEPVFYASASPDPAHFFRYLPMQTMAADTNKVYGTVKATLYHYKKTTTARGVVSFRIVDAKTGALLTVEKMPGEYVWISEWATFNGDERALSAEQLALTRLKEKPAPVSQDLFIEFTRPIYDQITTKISAFYKGY